MLPEAIEVAPGMTVDRCKKNAFHPQSKESLDALPLTGGVISGLAEHDVIAGAPSGLFRFSDDEGIRRTADVRHDDAKRLRPSSNEASGKSIRAVTQSCHRMLNTPAGGRADVRTAIDDARHCDRGNARVAGDVADGDTGCALMRRCVMGKSHGG